MRFDHAPDRRLGDSTKWNRWAGREVIPLWVADLDFPAPEPVLEALRARVAHGVFGYADPPPALAEACAAMLGRHGAPCRGEWITWLPSLVAGLNLCCRAFAGPGRRVITTTPIYPPFLTAPANQGAECVRVPMVMRGGRWEHDLEALARELERGCSCVLLCLPHNPLGRCFDQAELTALAEVLARSDAVVVSDEAWADLVLEPGRRHLPLAVAAPTLAARLVTLVSPAKAFNLPGLRLGAAICPDPDLRRRLRAAGAGLFELNTLGYHAAAAAWGGACQDWLEELRIHLRANRDRACARLARLPGLALHLPEATALIWIDCRGLGVEDPERFFVEAGVGLMPGAWFGAPGFLRLNLGCTAALLDQALERMERAVLGRMG
jgi:cystathionine beta-lyase